METHKGISAFVAGVSGTQGSTEDLSTNLTNGVIAASGCHVGVNLGNQLYHTPGVTNATWSDFPEEFAKKKVGVYLASTGYSIISQGSLPVKSESLMVDFFKQLLHEPNYTVGDAYKATVQDYIKWLWPWWDPDDRRVLAITTLYGIPNYSLSVRQPSYQENTAKPPTQIYPYSRHLSTGTVSRALEFSLTDWALNDEGVVIMPHVSYLSSIGKPILPVITIEGIFPSGTSIRNVDWNVEKSSYINIQNEVPFSEAVTLDSNGEVITETGVFTHTDFFPETKVFTRSIAAANEGVSLNLQIVPVQYNQTTHTTRIWTQLSFDVEYDIASSFDSDGDGLPDYWEKAYGLDPLNDSGDSGSDADIDGDGLTNAEEYSYSTNPTSADTDGDGVQDLTEIGVGTDPNNPFSKAALVFLPIVTRNY